jgi:hypothetical protein
VTIAETKAAQTVTKAKDSADIQAELDERFAKFGLRPLTDADVWALSMAAMVMPDGNPGAEAYLAQVTGVPIFAHRLTIWGRVLAVGIAQAGYKARDGKRRRAYVESYDESWGRYAVADGLTLALYGYAADAIGKSKDQGYRRIRDFVGGALVDSIAEFRMALSWSCGYQRDRVFEGRWEFVTGLNFGDARRDATIGREDRGCFYPMFAPGCTRITVGTTLEDQDKILGSKHGRMPETLYRGLRPTDWWDESVARQMRKAPVVMIYPATD